MNNRITIVLSYLSGILVVGCCSEAALFAIACWRHQPHLPWESLLKDAVLLMMLLASWRMLYSMMAWEGLVTQLQTAPPPPAPCEPLTGPRIFELTSEQLTVALLEHVLPTANIGAGAVRAGVSFQPSGMAVVTLEPLPPGCKTYTTVSVQKPHTTSAKMNSALN